MTNKPTEAEFARIEGIVRKIRILTENEDRDIAVSVCVTMLVNTIFENSCCAPHAMEAMSSALGTVYAIAERSAEDWFKQHGKETTH